MSGGVDMDECPREGTGATRCACGVCARCGYPKHSGVHAPVEGAPPGSRAWGHEFVAGEPEDATVAGWSLKRLAWAYGCAKKRSAEEKRLRAALVRRVLAGEQPNE